MKNCLYGAAGGDICGSRYEFGKLRTKEYDKVKLVDRNNFFTDDTVCTMGVADAILKHRNPTVEQFRDSIQEWCRKYPNRGYGGKFRNWIENPVPYGSWGNGSAMRVSACGFVAKTKEEAAELAKTSAMCSHNDPAGVLGAIVVTQAIFYAKNKSNEEAYELIDDLLRIHYPQYYDSSLDDIRPEYHFDSSCEGSVPVALLAFLESNSYEECIKLAISMGGDADTLAAIAGSIAYAYYGEMQKLVEDQITEVLPADMQKVVRDFDALVNE